MKKVINCLMALLIALMFTCEKDSNNKKPPDPGDTTHIDTTHTIRPIKRDTTFIVNNIVNRIIEGQSYYNNNTDNWNGVEIDHSKYVLLTFRNNLITSRNLNGYMLHVGDEEPGSNDNNLDNAIISGNKFIWEGDVHNTETITHGLFNGHQKNTIITYNYMNNVPMVFIRKSGNDMGNNGGGIAYNIVKGGKVAVNIKGMSNINVYNNTFYADLKPSENWRGLVYVYKNTNTNNSVAHGTKIFNNIFYVKYNTPCIKTDSEDELIGLESDYNVFWCETESNASLFRIGNTSYTFKEWQARGYDLHSKLMNPKFKDFVSFIPTSKLSYGKNLGTNWNLGINTNNKWTLGLSPLTTKQGNIWQVGAILY